MMNPTKFGSLHLDTPNSRYEFLKFESIFEKHLNQIPKYIKHVIATEAGQRLD